VPVFEHILVEAPNFEEACRAALDDIEQPWGEDARVDYECARSTTIERAVEVPNPVLSDLSAGVWSPSHLLYDAGLDPLPIPAEFSDESGATGISIGFV
jgi:hypothetical protein